MIFQELKADIITLNHNIKNQKAISEPHNHISIRDLRDDVEIMSSPSQTSTQCMKKIYS
jgi:hypothetical protein